MIHQVKLISHAFLWGRAVETKNVINHRNLSQISDFEQTLTVIWHFPEFNMQLLAIVGSPSLLLSLPEIQELLISCSYSHTLKEPCPDSCPVFPHIPSNYWILSSEISILSSAKFLIKITRWSPLWGQVWNIW